LKSSAGKALSLIDAGSTSSIRGRGGKVWMNLEVDSSVVKTTKQMRDKKDLATLVERGDLRTR